MILVPHDSTWSLAFASLEAVLKNALGDYTIGIEHVGSTAIPDLRAKPILDVDIVMPDYAVFPSVIEVLHRLGYTHSGNQGIAGREAFIRVDRSVPWTEPRRSWMDHHLYVCPSDGDELRRHMKFRDVLRKRTDLRNEYEKLKLSFERKSGGDRKNYASIKETECRAFVERVLRKEPNKASEPTIKRTI